MFSYRDKRYCKRKYLVRLVVLLTALFFIAGEAYATGVDLNTAQTVAKHFYLSASFPLDAAIAKSSPVDFNLELVHKVFADSKDSDQKKNAGRNTLLYYVFNVNDDDGFVVVSGNEKIKPILAYAFKGSYKESEQAPAFHAWMEDYKSQILYALENDTETEQSITEEWNRYKSGIQEKGQTQSSYVGPLLSTRWNQNCHYNNTCPFDSTGPCKRAPAGCCAVAMAQILKFWDYPDTCKEMQGYKDSDYRWIDGIEATSYDWSIMPDVLTDSSEAYEINEVSKLIYHCGVSINMNYGPNGSLAGVIYIPEALSKYFSYNSSVQHVDNKNYIPKAWENLLKVELDMGRPFLYIAASPNAGHAFVCDGYQNSGYFHFNWGWSGNCDGYYYLDNLAPGAHYFNKSHRAIIGIEPAFKPPDPWDNITAIIGCGSANKHTYKGGDIGSWSAGICDWSTPGSEQIYSFIAPESGNYCIEVTAVNGYVDCGWKETCCGEGGWNCIGDICSTGKYGSMSWDAGKTYYILLDDEDTAPGDFQFHVMLLDPSSSMSFSSVEDISLFPNPVNDLLNIECDAHGILFIEIASLNGQQVFIGEMEGSTHQIDFSSFPTGIYFITIRSKDFTSTRKIIKL